MPEQPNREVAVLNAALELPPSDRTAYLDGACAGDAALRKRVESLLRAHDEAGTFLETSPASLTIVATPVTEKPGDRIGRYKLLQQIGEGGMGVVYMAEQREPVVRKVALKIIKLGMDSAQVVARFEAERQALALMDHPNIAKVLDGGATESGRPYFVMELVSGLPITQFCDDANLSTRERLELFLDVCSAVQHAHQKGIIHRDLKPSNVLVTLYGDKPVPKVIDFGVAKATQGRLTEKTLFTQFQQFIGTPAYMSPEQASLSGLDIDTRSDIYGLGVLLYELLTGAPPFDGKELLKAGLDEMRRTIREQEPPKSSNRISTLQGEDLTTTARHRRTDPPKLVHLVRGDLDWIVMKALEKDRVRRYETANGLAADIKRHLANEPVVARPPSAAYRFQKMVRRNKVVFAAGSAVAVALVAGLVVSTWMFFREKQARREAIANALAERKAREAEAAERKRAEEVSNYLVNAFRSPDPARDGPTITVAEVLDRDARELENRFLDEPLTRADLLSAIGWSYVGLGLYDRATPLFEKEVDLLSQALGPEDLATSRAKQTLAIRYWASSGRVTEAVSLAEEVLRVRQLKLGPEHPDTLVAALSLGNYYYAAGRTNEGASMMEDAFKHLQATPGAERRGDMFWAMTGMADMYRTEGRTQEALAIDEPLLGVRKEKLGPDHPDTLHSMCGLAADYIALGRLRDAETLLQESLKLSRVKLGPEHPQTLIAVRMLTEVLQREGKTTEANALLEAQPAPLAK